MRRCVLLGLSLVVCGSALQAQPRLLPVPPGSPPSMGGPRGRVIVGVHFHNPYLGPVLVPVDGYAVPYGSLPYGAVPYGIVEPRFSVRVVSPTVVPRSWSPRVDVSGIDLDVQQAPWAKEGDRPRHDQPPPPRPKPEVAKRPEPLVEPPPKVKLPEPPAPKANPLDEARRLTALGAAAFRSREYGLAARRFQQAKESDPLASQPMFLLGQAYFALGKYRDAVQMIGLGLGLDPAWPKNAFRPRFDLYGDHPEDWQQHMEALVDARNRQPNDAGFLFVLAHQFWFDDQRVEATRLFRQVRPLVADPALVDLFLKATP